MVSHPQRTLPTSESPVATTDSRPVPDPTVLTTQQLAVAIENVKQLFGVRFEAMDKAVVLLQASADRRPTVGEVALKADERFLAIERQFQDREKVYTALTEVIKLHAEGQAGVHGTKIEGLEKRLDHKYVETAADITHLRDLMSERIEGLANEIRNRFAERDKRAEQLTAASQAAISAALQAQKEAAAETLKSSSLAITKSETATVESIKQLQALFQSTISGLSTQILDVKSRLDKGEGGSAGQREERNDQRNATIDTRGLVFGVVGAALGLAALIVTVIVHLAAK